MKRIVISFFTLALTMIPAYPQMMIHQAAQSDCALSAANSPTVRGIRLGMTLQQVLALFPGSSKRQEIRSALDRAKAAAGNEAVYLLFYPATDGGGERLAGVDSILVGVYKDQVVDFSVSYVGPTWNTVDDWIEKLAETLGLPRSRAWAAGPSENPNKILKCKGVEIEAAVQGGGGSIRVRNTETNTGTTDRRDVGEEKKRREFKP